MKITLASVQIKTDTGLVADRVQNSFVLSHDDPLTSGEITTLVGCIARFYISVPTGGLTALSDLFSPEVFAGVGHPINFYDISAHLDGSPHGSPYEVRSFEIPPPSIGAPTGLPAEVAAVLTLHGSGAPSAPVEVADNGDADTVPQRPRQSHTGRLYLGPLNTMAVELNAGAIRPAATIRDTALLAAQTFSDETTAAGCTWSVWSRKLQSIDPINNASMDNAFDTQRRRGTKATLRTFHPFV